ncbi:alpha/beta hydrolase family protein [Lacticaseibacillus brantae]|uniref:Esterase lipase n=1 Tax=Lacticaseibacillus brantae DSM 23927 TaxID=1423727 RepID=A0A0R2B807_9LACO|nr:alpha/beta hydrolase [Lacticaseibacillus brantae]KRM72246.1 esterase lipase [Lacticaseibacillus brantae DSM 23927]
MEQTTIVFDQANNLDADIYTPAEPNGAAIVFVHGGGWLRGDKANETDIGQYFSDQGYLVAIPNYRLAPAALFPAAQTDLDQFVAWLVASPLNFDRNRLGLLGASVGGTMVLTNSLTTSLPAVSWSGILDFERWFDAHQDVEPALDAAKELGLTDRHAINDSFYKYFIQNYLGDPTPEALSTVNPVNLMTDKLGPTLLFNSADELTPLSGPLAFVEAAAQSNRDVTLHVVPGIGHARDYTDFALASTLAFFNQTLN